MTQIGDLDMAQSYDQREYEKKRADAYNATVGGLSGYDCKECLNKGHILTVDNSGASAVRDCECMAIRRTLKRMEKSGLKDLLTDCTFDTFRTDSSWQAYAKQAALSYLEDYRGNWFFAGGQVGAGKTHLCTAIVGELLKQGLSARYMLWRDETVSLKAVITDDEVYSMAITALKEVEILYIDDFLKTEKGKYPTTADINIAFELLNYRYNRRELVTLISSERPIDNILEIDEAVGSRIYQRTKKYCIVIEYDRAKNYRLQ